MWNWIVDRRSVSSPVKFQFQNLERRSVQVPKFGTSIRIGVKITSIRHALMTPPSTLYGDEEVALLSCRMALLHLVMMV